MLGQVALSAAEANYIYDSLCEVRADIAETEAYVRNALGSVEIARSTAVDYLSGPNDLYAKVEILQDLDAAIDSLRKALL